MNNKKESQITSSSLSLIPINTQDNNFFTLMLIYEQALIQVKNELNIIQNELNNFYEYNVVSNITHRIKAPESIINKMKRKNYELNYKELIEKINDVAGIRIICLFKSDIIKVKEMIDNNPNIKVLEEKDYITKSKKSGYTGLHIICQTPVNIAGASVQVKLEIQIRTMAMDFWSTAEHKIKYKAKNKLNKRDSRKMIFYAKILNKIDGEISKINAKYVN